MTRKERVSFSVEQKLGYASLMVHEGYINKKIMKILGTGDATVSRW